MENNKIMTKQCKYLVENGVCNGKACKTCHYNEAPKQDIAQSSINYGAVKRYNSKNGKTYRTEVMRF